MTDLQRLEVPTGWWLLEVDHADGARDLYAHPDPEYLALVRDRLRLEGAPAPRSAVISSRSGGVTM